MLKRKAREGWNVSRSMVRLLGDVLYPPKCALCSAPVDAAHAICTDCFTKLHFISAPHCDCCGLPFEVAPSGPLRCASCLADPPPYTLARAALVYDEVSRPLITRFKYGDRLHLATLLARLMRQAGAEAITGAEVMVPVPLHWRRHMARRYNQSLMLARALAGMSDLPVDPSLLCRIKPTPPQVGLSRSQRRRNVAAAFAVPESSRVLVEGRKILLIDDVMTSGATLEACSRVLISAGASEVRVLTLARRVLVD